MLQIGDRCPQFSLKDQWGQTVTSNDIIGSQLLVIFFYPKNNTRGCTAEACAFRDEYETFVDHGAKVIGISSDSISSHEQFANEYHLPFTLLADTKKEVRETFGVPGNLLGLIPGRVTFIIDKSGIIRGIYNSQINPVAHSSEALACIKSLIE
jgi:peroxiredoxin Q/BCP